jgi:hypothetical protein
MKVGGEYSDIKEVITVQDNDESVIFGLAYSNPDIEYKVENVLQKRPEILVIGTSRTMQFTASSFDGSFYNAGGVVNKISQIPVLLEYLKEQGYIPKTIILGLDQYFFNEAWDPVSYDHDFAERIANHGISFKPNPTKILQDAFKGKIRVGKLIISKNIGINARMNKNGFRGDGTYYYGGLIENGISLDKDFNDTYSRICNGDRRFEFSDHINTKAIEEFRKVALFCGKNDILLLSFLPPYAPSVWKKMEETGKYRYIGEIYPALQASLSGVNNQYVFDLSCMADSNDPDFFDGFHGNASIYTMIARIMNEEARQKTRIH